MEETTTAAAAPAAAPAPVAAPVQGPAFPPGTMLREYETNILLKPDLGEEATERLRERFRALVIANGGKVIRFSTWNRKKLMYRIQDLKHGIYVHMHYLGPTKLVAEVERNLRNTDDVIRYLSVKIADESDAARLVEVDVKHAGDQELERPPREDRPARDDLGDVDGDGELDGLAAE